MRIALQRRGEGRAELHRVGAQRLQPLDVLAAPHAAGGDQRHLALDARIAQEAPDRGQHGLEVETAIAEVRDPRRAEVPARMAGMLDDHGRRQPLPALPFLPQQRHAAGLGQDGDQGGARMVLRELGQVQRQPRAHHQRVDAGLERRPHRGRVVAHRAHHIDRQQATPFAEPASRPDLTRQRLLVGLFDHGLLLVAVAHRLAARHEVGVMPAQVHRRDRAPGALPRDAAGQPVRRNPHPHASLNDGQQVAASEAQGAQSGGADAVEERSHGHGRGSGKTKARMVAARAPMRLDAAQQGPGAPGCELVLDSLRQRGRPTTARPGRYAAMK